MEKLLSNSQGLNQVSISALDLFFHNTEAGVLLGFYSVTQFYLDLESLHFHILQSDYKLWKQDVNKQLTRQIRRECSTLRKASL